MWDCDDAGSNPLARTRLGARALSSSHRRCWHFLSRNFSVFPPGSPFLIPDPMRYCKYRIKLVSMVRNAIETFLIRCWLWLHLWVWMFDDCARSALRTIPPIRFFSVRRLIVSLSDDLRRVWNLEGSRVRMHWPNSLFDQFWPVFLFLNK